MEISLLFSILHKRWYKHNSPLRMTAYALNYKLHEDRSGSVRALYDAEIKGASVETLSKLYPPK